MKPTRRNGGRHRSVVNNHAHKLNRRRMLVATVFGLAGASAIAGGTTPRELSRIERLIQCIERRTDLTFVRNGSSYSAADAGRFLRGKFEAMGGEIATAQDFITRIASRSSTSGRAYEVRFADGKTVLAEQFLTEELRRIDSSPHPA